MTRPFSGAASALRDLVEELRLVSPDTIKRLVLDFVLDFVVPLVACLSVVVCCLYAYRCAKRLCFPPTAEELLVDALTVLQVGGNEELSEKSLLQIVQKYPSHVPALQSLAAFYIYVKRQASPAAKVLSLKACQGTDFDSLRMDLKALQQGHGHMIHTIWGEEEYLRPRFAVASNGKYSQKTKLK